MRHDSEVRRAVDTYQLGLLRVPASGRAGELLGRGTGSSLEFQEYREYTPGDDIRHLDWAAYGRSDTLMVRLYREEISPRTEILMDTSASMASTEAKSLVTRQLSGLFALLAGGLGGMPAVIPLTADHPLQRMGLDQVERLADWPFESGSSLAELVAEGSVPLKPRSVRIVVSDFLYPLDPDTLIRQLASDASTLWVVQVLSGWEARPEPVGGRRLVDNESAAEADLVINQSAIADYLDRLRRLQRGLIRACRRAEASFVTVEAEAGLSEVCRDDLCGAGLLRVA